VNFDWQKTVSLVKGALTDHRATWASYLAEGNDWKTTALQLTGPLIIANVVLVAALSRLLGGFGAGAQYGGFLVTVVMGLIAAAIGLGIAVAVFNYLAGLFKGSPDFSRAFAAVSLAAVPAWVAGIVAAAIPFLGFIIALAGGILSLVFLYQVIPLALNVPQDKRVVHFIVSLVCAAILNAVIGAVLGVGMAGGQMTAPMSSRDEAAAGSPVGAGMLGEWERQSRLMEAATADRYEPPADGRLTADQVERYISVREKTARLHAEYQEKLEQAGRAMEQKQAQGDEVTLGDLGSLYAGVGKAMTANNAEMEVVKTGGGNWAEHNWVKEQLRNARIHRGEGSKALAHNYKLRQKYADQLDAVE